MEKLCQRDRNGSTKSTIGVSSVPVVVMESLVANHKQSYVYHVLGKLYLTLVNAVLNVVSFALTPAALSLLSLLPLPYSFMVK